MWPECPDISTRSYMIKLPLFKSHCVGLKVAICNDKICNHWFLQDFKQTNASCISLHILNLTIFTPEQFWSCSYLAHFFLRAKAANNIFTSANFVLSEAHDAFLVWWRMTPTLRWMAIVSSVDFGPRVAEVWRWLPTRVFQRKITFEWLWHVTVVVEGLSLFHVFPRERRFKQDL